MTKKEYRNILFMPIVIAFLIGWGPIPCAVMKARYENIVVARRWNFRGLPFRRDSELGKALRRFHFGAITERQYNQAIEDIKVYFEATTATESMALSRDTRRWRTWSALFVIARTGTAAAFALIGIGAAVLLASAVCLRHHLRPRHYEWLSVEDAFLLVAFSGSRAFRLPPAEEVLVLPCYSPDVESLLAYLKARRVHKKRSRASSSK